jgi:hypothetical protein
MEGKETLDAEINFLTILNSLDTDSVNKKFHYKK